MKKSLLFFGTILLIAAMLFSGCSASSTGDTSTNEDYYSEVQAAEAPAYDVEKDYDEGVEVEAGGETSSDGSTGTDIDIDSAASILEPSVDRKIIYSAYIETQTTNYNEDYQSIMDSLDAVGGYVEDAYEYGTEPEDWQDEGRYANLTLRVPSDKFDSFITMLKGLGKTISSSVSGEDISLQYYDVETKLEILSNRKERLLELLDQNPNLDDLLELERELSDVIYDIEMQQTSLRTYDSLIDFSTVTITLQEVNEITEVVTSEDTTIGERISSGFYSVLSVLADFGEGLLVFVLAGSPILLILAVIIIVIIVLVKRSNKKHKALTNSDQRQGGTDNEK
ncbi:MAG: DUF4349 domain-containing protein [Eubacteriales bacterium]|nr:DUF4349 domain-containing protein [Eubacteriales bacterium]